MSHHQQKTLQVLLTEDNPGDRDLVKEYLDMSDNSFAVQYASTLEEALSRLSGGMDVLLLDLGLPDSQGLATFETVMAARPEMPVIILTGNSDDQLAKNAIQGGAQDFIVKDSMTPEILEKTIHYAIERKSIENELLAIYDNAPVSLMLVDKNRRIRRVNKLAASFSNRNESELRGLKGGEALGCVFSIENKQGCGKETACETCRIQHIVMDTLETGTASRNVEIGMTILKNSRHQKVFLSVSTARVMLGSGPHVLVALQDISSLKEAENKLRESEEFKNRMIDSSGDCIKLLDLDGNLIYMSAGGQKKLDITDIRNFLNKSWIDFWQDQDKINAQEAVFSAKKGKDGRFQGYSPTLTGLPRWWDVIISPIHGPDGKVEQLLAISRDISEQKKMEAMLIQARKMEAIGTLAGGIAHDFNNILASIIGFTELSLQETDAGSPIHDNLQEVYLAGNRARELVKQILTFARQTEEEIKPMQVDVILKETLKLIRSSIPSTIRIRQEILSRSLIMGNPTQIHQVFMNLCTNAANAMEANGGTLSVRLEDIRIDDHPADSETGLNPGDYVKAVVEDTGDGIPPHLISKIFDPFFTTREPGRGTGMGLSLVHGIVKNYQGIITVDSEPGKGTVFTIYLPVTRKQQDLVYNDPPPLPKGSERILLVDDEISLAKMGRQTLESLGYSVSAYTSSIETLEQFRKIPDEFDLVISDMTMPDMTGDRLAAEIMKIRPNIPVIICTGYSRRLTPDIASAMGIKGFLFKPVAKSELARKVRAVLDGTDMKQEEAL